MDGVTVSVLGALVALAVAIVLILKKVQPTYAMIFGAVIGGLVGGAGLTGTVSFIISGTQGIVSAIIRIVTAGILAGALIESGEAERIAADTPILSLHPYVRKTAGVITTGSEVCARVRLLAGDAAEEFERLPIVQDAELLQNILYSGVWTRFEAAFRPQQEEQA